eukprot:g4975.t1
MMRQFFSKWKTASLAVAMYLWIYVSDFFDLSPPVRMGVQMIGTICFVMHMRYELHSSDKLALSRPAPPLVDLSYVKGGKKECLPQDFSGRDGNGTFVLLFWATWSKESRDAICIVNSLVRRFRQKGVLFVAVSNEPEATIHVFLEKMSANKGNSFVCPVAHAPSRVAISYKVKDIPWAFVVHKGIVEWSGNVRSSELPTKLSTLVRSHFNERINAAKRAGEASRKKMNEK